MHGALQDAVKQHVAGVIGTLAKTTMGFVTSYDPNRYAVKVTLSPSDIETGWMPILAQQIGNGWGVYFAPNIGDQCTVGFWEMYPDAPFCMGFLPSDEAVPPSVLAGEMLLRHASGALLQLDHNGNAVVSAQGNVTVNATGNVNVTATGAASISATSLSVDCNLAVTGTISATGDIVAGAISLEAHTHTSATPGSPTSQPL